ncbi:unnamed protein product [Urochloa decumbens]
MIKKWYIGETLLVGKPEHKAAIEKELEIPCCCDEAAMEVMWGVENLLHILVPNEETELRAQDRKLRSQGLHMFLQSLGYNSEKELVNGQIAETACYIYHCLEINKKQLKSLGRLDYLEKEGIDTKGWDAWKYAAAVSIMCMDEPSSDTSQVFSEEELRKINGGKGKHTGLIKDNFKIIYKRAVDVNQPKVEKLKELDDLVKAAQERPGRAAAKLQEEPDESSESIAKKRKMGEA